MRQFPGQISIFDVGIEDVGNNREEEKTVPFERYMNAPEAFAEEDDDGALHDRGVPIKARKRNAREKIIQTSDNTEKQ